MDGSKRARVKDSSRKAYAYSTVRFIQWLSANEAALLNKAWVTEVVKASGKKLPAGGRLTDVFKKAFSVERFVFASRRWWARWRCVC